MGGCRPERGSEASAAALQAHRRWTAARTGGSLGPSTWDGGASMGYLIDILIGALSRIVTGELSAHVEPLARWIIDRAVSTGPLAQRLELVFEQLKTMNLG